MSDGLDDMFNSIFGKTFDFDGDGKTGALESFIVLDAMEREERAAANVPAAHTPAYSGSKPASVSVPAGPRPTEIASSVDSYRAWRINYINAKWGERLNPFHFDTEKEYREEFFRRFGDPNKSK